MLSAGVFLPFLLLGLGLFAFVEDDDSSTSPSDDNGGDTGDGGGGGTPGNDGPDLLALTGNEGEVYSGPGNDTIDGSASDDRIWTEGGDDSVQGGDGDDLISLLFGDDFAEGGAGDDTLLGGVGSDSLDGGSGDDRLFGNSDSDTLRGSDGRDTLFGGSGDDSLQGGAGGDYLNGGAGNDTIFGRNGFDLIIDAGGSNLILGGNGNDDLNSIDTENPSANPDTVDGGDGNDSIAGDDGDILTGGADNDLFMLQSGLTETITITDFDPQQERLSLVIEDHPSIAPQDLMPIQRMSADGTALELVVADAVAVRLEGLTTEDSISYQIRIGDSAFGGAGNDRIISDEGEGRLFGGDGDDFVSQIGNYSSTLSGGNGDDRIEFRTQLGDPAPEDAQAEMTGGDGADEFILSRVSEDMAVITDFSFGEDKIKIYNRVDIFNRDATTIVDVSLEAAGDNDSHFVLHFRDGSSLRVALLQGVPSDAEVGPYAADTQVGYEIY